VSHQQLDAANRAIQRILGVSLPPLTARKMVEHWADSLKLPDAVAHAAAEIADNCSSITVTRSTVETVDHERLQELSGQGYTVKQQISPSPNTAGSAAQIMCNHFPPPQPPQQYSWTTPPPCRHHRRHFPRSGAAQVQSRAAAALQPGGRHHRDDSERGALLRVQRVERRRCGALVEGHI
jgi:hypothetical protein